VMLRHAYERLATPTVRDFSMAVECFALHARTLVEFLSEKTIRRRMFAPHSSSLQGSERRVRTE
jgi:hypothetical protein